MVIFNTTAIAPFPIYIWPLGFGFLIGGTVGVFGNAMIIMALFKSDLLKRNRCNILVGNLAFSDFVSSLFTIVSGAYAAVSPLASPAMSNEWCYWLLAPTIVSYSAGSILTLAIGLDRMTSLQWPVFYKTLTWKYISSAVGASWAFGGLVAAVGFWYKDPDEVVPACVVPTALRSEALSFWNGASIFINMWVITVYALAYTKARSLGALVPNRADAPLRNNRLLNSLLICVSIYIIGWVLTMMVIFLVNILSLSPSVIFHCSMYVGLLADINVGSDFFVYYVRSGEFRRAFKAILKI